MGTIAIKSYADFEQLAGGMRKIFSDMDISVIEKDASEAYKTLGMSASEYLAIINDVGASFASTMGDEAGYEAAKKGLTAISDYASGTGKSFNELQQKLAMISRSTSSYQSIADQFSGILPATSEGFLQQAQAAGILSTEYEKLTDVPIEEYQKAVTDMLALGVDTLNLTGNTAAEAATTLSGSVNAMGAAWSNLVTGIANDNANLEELINNFVVSTEAVFLNVLPVVEQVLTGVGSLIETLLPVIVEKIPEIVNTILPDLLISGTNMLITIINGIVTAFPSLVDTAYQLIVTLITTITSNANMVFNSGSDVLLSFITGIADKIPELLQMAMDMIISLALALTDPNVLTDIINSGIRLILSLIDGILHALPQLVAAAPQIIAQLVAALVANSPQLLVAALQIVTQLAGSILSCINKLLNIVPDIYIEMCEAFDNVDWASIGLNLLYGIWDGIKSGWDWLVDCVEDLANDLFGAACDELDINSPSKKFKWIGEMCIEGVDEPLEEYNPYETFQNSMETNVSGLQATFAKNTLGTSQGTPFDYAAIGSEIKDAISGVGVYVSGERVGQIITPTVNDELVNYEERRI